MFMIFVSVCMDLCIGIPCLVSLVPMLMRMIEFVWSCFWMSFNVPFRWYVRCSLMSL